ncbi:MAG: class I SAM-dependent methyltransferase [Candidatus Thorarchaeota archaeon]|jgi:SAM-dependent methyltransferase
MMLGNKLAKWFYEFGYRHTKMPWDVGPRTELVELIESGRIEPCRAIDLGSGTASNCIFLAQHDFEVTGVDYAKSAIELGRARARKAGVSVDFILDDLTDLHHVNGTFDLLVDYGTLDDLPPKKRDLYMKNILPLTHQDSWFLLFCFEWSPRWWERPLFDRMALEPGEVKRRFGDYFEIERISGTKRPDFSRFPPGYGVYLMKRK